MQTRIYLSFDLLVIICICLTDFKRSGTEFPNFFQLLYFSTNPLPDNCLGKGVGTLYYIKKNDFTEKALRPRRKRWIFMTVFWYKGRRIFTAHIELRFLFYLK